MTRPVLRLLLCGLAVIPGAPAFAKLCSIDAVPAATLLLPYFEVDVTNPSGVTTVLSINNAVAAAHLAHVTLWTDYAVPTLRFDVYLTGYDVQTLNVRDLLNGFLPNTAVLGQDPGDTVSPRGTLSEDSDFPGCPVPTVLPPVLGDSLIRAHRGLDAPSYGGCVAFPHEDHLARGYITVDVVSRCSALAPSDAGYFADVATAENVLWGTYFYLDPGNDSAQQESLVHVEACDVATIDPPPPGTCSGGFEPGDYTFYGRYGTNATDQREPLPSTFSLAYVEGGAFDGGTRLAVWRDTKRPADTKGRCGPFRPDWYPLTHWTAFAFDEQESVTDVCGISDIIDPPPPTDGCFPLATQDVGLDQDLPGWWDSVSPPFDFGWLFVNLSEWSAGEVFPQRAQAWITVRQSASGRYAVATAAAVLDDLCSPQGGQQTTP